MSKLKVQDLRIGNFVYGLNEFQGTALPICSLHSDNTLRLSVGKDSIGCFSANVIEPIEIDFDWLEKFQFKYNEETECYHYYNLIINKLFVMMDIDIHVHIKYVHQLQNLYFTLTGYELECV